MTDFGKFDELEQVGHRIAASRLLFKWLSDDTHRAALYGYLSSRPQVLKFQSRADARLHQTEDSDPEYRQDVYLLTKRAHIVSALTDTRCFSNSPYQALGSGTFMLALDGGDHDAQRKFASAYLDHLNAKTVCALSSVAFMAAAALPLKQRQFDLAELAEQAAVRFVGFLFGFAQVDHPLIEEAARAAYLGLNYQILGRHFVTRPGILLDAKKNMGGLLQKTADLIDLYRERIGREQDDEYQAIDDELKELRTYKDRHLQHPLADFVPILRRIGEAGTSKPGPCYSTTELAVIVVGMIAGTIGNVQASVAIAISDFFRDCKRFKDARDTADKSRLGNKAEDEKLRALICDALRSNPPVAFLPRRTNEEVDFGDGRIPADRIVILCMGGATRDDGCNQANGGDKSCDPLIFGGYPDIGGYVHQCIGERLALPLVTRIVRQVLVLPGLAESLDPRSGKPLGLEKLWGFNCRKYPLEFDRFAVLKQSPLNVIMKVRMPVSVHAEALKEIIKYGAPRIEKKLRDAKLVHFAWFEFLENDTKLALHTVYDRDFDAYIEHFALEIGPLFDLLFEHIQDAPPQPVKEFPKEFVDTIRRYNARPAGDYFFSAYPRAEAAKITHQFPRVDE